MNISDIKVGGVYTQIGREGQLYLEFKVLSKTKNTDPCERIHIQLINSGRIDYKNEGECNDWVRETHDNKIHNEKIID